MPDSSCQACQELIAIGAITTTALGLLNRSGVLGSAESHAEPLISR
ncbi:hypothetical protein [Nocardia aurea]|uniref:Uncharacterized protein n=1 Tax=Nocardia aurea TaxID=2144174 RepID=A0ABV3FX03_9NOCA